MSRYSVLFTFSVRNEYPASKHDGKRWGKMEREGQNFGYKRSNTLLVGPPADSHRRGYHGRTTGGRVVLGDQLTLQILVVQPGEKLLMMRIHPPEVFLRFEMKSVDTG